MEIQVNNSFCKVTGSAIPEVEDAIRQLLTYKNDIEAEKAQCFYQLSLAKRYNNNKLKFMTLAKIKKLEENEWVCWYQNRTFPTGLLNMVRELLQEMNVDCPLSDQRVPPEKDFIARFRNKPHTMRYYQREAVEAALKETRGVIEAAVGTGKSVCMCYILAELEVNTLIVVPSRGLLDQLYNDFALWFGRDKVECLDAKKVRSKGKLKPIRLITIQSLASLNKSDELDKIVSDINCLFIDEFHHSASASFTNLLKHLDHVYYRYGFTGTFMRNDGKILDLWGVLSNAIYTYPAHKATEEGFLTPLEVTVHNLPGRYNRNYHKEYDFNYSESPSLREKVFNICAETASETDQILILVNRKDKCGKIIHEYLNFMGVPNTYISGDDKKETITETISAFNEKEIRVLIGSSVIGEGVDIRATDHIIMAQGGKSEIAIVQATGRAVRLFPGKTTAYLHDFKFENTKYMQEHLEERIDIYKRNFNCKVTTE